MNKLVKSCWPWTHDTSACILLFLQSGPLSNFPQLHIQVSDYRSNYLVIQFSGKHPIPAILSLQESSMILSEYSVGNTSFSCSDILRHGNNWMPDILYYKSIIPLFQKWVPFSQLTYFGGSSGVQLHIYNQSFTHPHSLQLFILS